MLCGVGGRTIAEAKQRLGFAEFRDWAAYRARRGSLNLGLRVERGAAQLASLYAIARTGRTEGHSLYDFAPHLDAPDLDLEHAMKTWD